MLPVPFPVKVLLARFDHQTQCASALAPLGSVIERSGDLHFLKRCRIWQGYRVKMREIKVVNVGAFQRYAVVAGALSVDGDVRGTAAGTAHIRGLPGNAGGEIQ